MTENYRFAIRLVDYDEGRKKELKEFFLKSLHPKQGLDYFKGVLRSARDGEGQIVYTTNSPQDARRMAWTLQTHGGSAAIDGEFEDEDDL
jgi:hypothetical protein